MTKTELLRHIDSFRVKKPNPFYAKGLFPSVRQNKYLNYHRQDDNFFITASLAMVLKMHFKLLSEEEKALASEIIEGINLQAPRYINQSRFPITNFWRREVEAHFPYGYLSHLSKSASLPEDIDDTALFIYLNGIDKAALKHLKLELAKAHNQNRPPLDLPDKDIQALPYWSTNFGKFYNGELEICAIANLLIALNDYDFEPDEYYKASIKVLHLCIERGHYFKYAAKMSWTYPHTHIQLYHLARLYYVTGYKHLSLNHIAKLKADIKLYLSKKHPVNELVTLLLHSALIMLGKPTEYQFKLPVLMHDAEDYVLFDITFLAFSSVKWLRQFANNKYFVAQYLSTPLSLTYVLEYMLLSESAAKS